MIDHSTEKFPGLPPRPDPQTGEPFPPPGRAYRSKEGRPEFDRDRETRLSHKPDPPEGKGPVLAWHKESKRGKLTLFLTSMALFAVGMTIISFLDGDGGFDWITMWPIWLGFVVVSLLITGPITFTVLSAGADWFKIDKVRFGLTRRSGYIKLYELKNIDASAVSIEFYIELADDQVSVDLPLVEWQSDRRMWDLVYNGILHSVAAGANITKLARQILELDFIDELRFPNGPGEIDVASLPDDQVRKIMDDERIRDVLNVIQFPRDGTPEDFRQKFPKLTEDLLAGPADPAWITPRESSQ